MGEGRRMARNFHREFSMGSRDQGQSWTNNARNPFSTPFFPHFLPLFPLKVVATPPTSFLSPPTFHASPSPCLFPHFRLLPTAGRKRHRQPPSGLSRPFHPSSSLIHLPSKARAKALGRGSRFLEHGCCVLAVFK